MKRPANGYTVALLMLRHCPSLLPVRRLRIYARDVQPGDRLARKGRVVGVRASRGRVVLAVPVGTVERRPLDTLEVVVTVRRRRPKRRVRARVSTVAVPF